MFSGNWKRTALVFAVVGPIVAGVALARVVPAPGGTLPQVPVSLYGVTPPFSLVAGEANDRQFEFKLSRTMRVKLTFIKPKQVVNLTVSPKPTRWVNGNPVWVRKLCSCALQKVSLHATINKNTPTGKWVNLRFKFEATGYRAYWVHESQQVYNPNQHIVRHDGLPDLLAAMATAFVPTK